MAKEELGLLRNEKGHVCDPYFVATLKEHGIDPATVIEELYKVSD